MSETRYLVSYNKEEAVLPAIAPSDGGRQKINPESFRDTESGQGEGGGLGKDFQTVNRCSHDIRD
jgi:hypothetical protein